MKITNRLFFLTVTALALVFVACTPAAQDDPFVFATDDVISYTQVDRMGMPAIATAVISSKDNYNASSA